jgi:uncharacterized protein
MTLSTELDPLEARVFGVLIEKALTTPEQYPLSVNAATNAANQKTNRDPVLSLSEDEVAAALQRLEGKYMARSVFLSNSRVPKYAHNGKDALAVESTQLAILAELLLRGPQTPGELRTRASRMLPIDSLDQLMSLLAPLIERGFVQRLPPEAGSRAERYVQLMSPNLHPLSPAPDAGTAPVAASALPSLLQRVEALEAEVARLRQEIDALREKPGMPV